MLTNRSAPSATVTPVLVYPDVREAVDWLEGAFGFRERLRIGEDHRSQMRIGEDGAVVVADLSDDRVAPAAGPMTHLIKVRVSDVQGQFVRARDFGARVLMEPTAFEYGEITCCLEDLGGHRWEFSQTARDVDPADWGGKLAGEG